jgi:outer membrane protein OmpA-like peptidoglycan-associated protein/tetratricopeptide (TPR) repeat protein
MILIPCMIKKILLLLFISVVFPALLSGQDNPCKGTSNRKARKSYDSAMDALRDRRSGIAVNHLLKALEQDEEYADAIWRLGQLYFNQMRGKESEYYLKQLISLCPEYNVDVYFLLARIAYGREDYNTAVPYLEQFLKDVDKIRSDRDYDNAVMMLEQAKFLREVMGQHRPFNPFKVKDISTDEDEYLAIISPDGELAFFTRRSKAQPGMGSISWTEKYKEEFMMATRSNGHFDRGEVMPPPFNMTGNEGGATITARNDEIYFTICSNINIDGVIYNNCDIYYSRNFYDQWNPLEKLDVNGISLENTWDSQPSVSSDGKTLYFASDRPGGYGGTDIWVVEKDDNNEWGTPRNLGPRINTPGNEKTPFIHTDSQTLYFSSSDRVGQNDSLHPGLKGLGGYDIFFTRFANGVWSKPVNLGYPINSEADDLSFFVSTDGTTGYFASNKIEGSGGYDLYGFELYQEARPQKVLFIKGEVKDENDIPMPDTKIELKNIITDEIIEVDVDAITARYVAIAVFENDFVLTVKKPDHIYQSRFIDKDSAIFSAPVEINFEMELVETGKSYQLHDIYFATNSAQLSSKSLFILNEFIVFLKDNGNIRVDIHGHTDDVGDDAFNLELSKRRAQAVYDYLIAKGIPARRLSYKGLGKTRPVADNTTEEGRAKNRRTEFVISGR